MKIQKFQGSGKIAKLAKAVTPAVRTTRRTISKTPIRARIPQSDYNVTNQAIGYYLTGDPQNRFQLVKDIDLTAGQSNGETLFKIDQDTLTGDEIQQMIDQAIKTPETKNDIVKFSGTPIDTSDPIQRQLLIREYQRKYPNFSLYPKEREITTGGDEYYEIGKFPYDAAVWYQKDWMKNRLDDLVSDWRNEFGYYRFPENHSANMARGETILNNAGSNGVRVIIPKTQAGYGGGFYKQSGSNVGDSFIIANPYRTKHANYTVIHESLSHPTDDFVLNLKPDGSSKTIQQLYEEISKPEDLFPDYKSVMQHSNDSQKAYEARAINNEMVYRIIKNVVQKYNITWPNAANNPKHVRNFVDTWLSDDSELVRFLEGMNNAYANDYASLLRKYKGTEAAHTYADRIRNMIKTLPAIVGLSAGTYSLTNQNANEN